MDNEPTYYKVDTDIDTLYAYDSLDDQTVLKITDEVWADPLNGGGDWHDQNVAQANEDERARWTQAYTTFRSEVGQVTDTLDAARAAYQKAKEDAEKAATVAWNVYKTVVGEIEVRVEEVEAMRAEHEALETLNRVLDAESARAAEDAELGPRTWVTFHPNSSTAKVSPTMMQPVIHLAGCKVTEGREHLSYTIEYCFARKAEVQDVLLKGAPRMERGRSTPDRVFTKLCGRCKPHASLEEALGETYLAWRTQVESVQEPMPTYRGIAKALGLEDEWAFPSRSQDGYTVVSSAYYRPEGLIEPHEELIGRTAFRENGRSYAVEDCTDHLEHLMAVLPSRGFAVRRVCQPARLGGKDGALSTSAVAVRRMTIHEIRQAKEAK
jgi:hypothetical protein